MFVVAVAAFAAVVVLVLVKMNMVEELTGGPWRKGVNVDWNST